MIGRGREETDVDVFDAESSPTRQYVLVSLRSFSMIVSVERLNQVIFNILKPSLRFINPLWPSRDFGQAGCEYSIHSTSAHRSTISTPIPPHPTQPNPSDPIARCPPFNHELPSRQRTRCLSLSLPSVPRYGVDSSVRAAGHDHLLAVVALNVDRHRGPHR